MAQLVGDLEIESAHAAQTQARAQQFLSTIVAKATGKPSAVAEAWGIPPEALTQSEAGEGTSRPKTDSTGLQVHPQAGERTLHHRDVSDQRPVHPSGEKEGGHSLPPASLVVTRPKSPRRDNPPRRSRADQHSQDCSRRCSKEREGDSDSAYSTYHPHWSAETSVSQVEEKV